MCKFKKLKDAYYIVHWFANNWDGSVTAKEITLSHYLIECVYEVSKPVGHVSNVRDFFLYRRRYIDSLLELDLAYTHVATSMYYSLPCNCTYDIEGFNALIKAITRRLCKHWKWRFLFYKCTLPLDFYSSMKHSCV